ncbi:type I secretion system ATPase [compost metagenome]
MLILDEPSAWLDEVSEQHLIESLTPWLKGRTLIVATHRPAVLRWVDRIIVLGNGRIVVDDRKDLVLARLRGSASPVPASGVAVEAG